MRYKKSKVKNLEDTAKRSEKEIHNLSRNLENVRSTVKTFKSENSQLRIKQVQTRNRSKKAAKGGNNKKEKSIKFKT